MGQTLSHGVYLPAEGERNCYSGLASNWNLLDTAIGDIAGKASATHTHGNITNDGKVGTTANLPLITGTGGAVQAGSFGNQANTFCEGNDSRLSDARTPVAHTHVTADVTDLLNTSHEWTKEQVCDEGFTSKSTTMERCVTPATTQHINFTFKDKNGKGFGAVRRYFMSNGEQRIQIFGNTRIKDGQYDETGSDEFFGFSEVITPDGTKYFSFDGYLNNSIKPRLTNTYQLGDSSYQWKSVYAQTYYYNGTAWGLDKANLWSGTNQFYSSVDYRDPVLSDKNPPSTYIAVDTFKHLGNDNTYWGGLKHNWLTDGYSRLQICVANHRLVNNAWTQGFWAINFAASKDFSDISFYPSTNNSINLGTSTNKWKSFNGVNPGALSIFNPSATQDPIDVPNTWVTDGSAWNTLNVSNMGDGWICLTYLSCGANDYILARFGGSIADYPSMIFPATMLGDSRYYLYLLIPIAKAMGNICLEIKLDSNAVLVKHNFIPAYGTV